MNKSKKFGEAPQAGGEVKPLNPVAGEFVPGQVAQ
jgi:hypothetical protein